jgi:tRNA (cytidine/uridine-2'-O-)-methyltransferase
MMILMQLERVWFFTKHAEKNYSHVTFQVGDWLVFGSESNGLPESVRSEHFDRCLGLPMIGPVRSLNLAVAVGVGLFEAHRQTAFATF